MSSAEGMDRARTTLRRMFPTVTARPVGDGCVREVADLSDEFIASAAATTAEATTEHAAIATAICRSPVVTA